MWGRLFASPGPVVAPFPVLRAVFCKKQGLCDCAVHEIPDHNQYLPDVYTNILVPDSMYRY